MLDAKEKEQLEKAQANSTSALSKIAEVEKGVAALRAEMETNNREIQKSLTNLLALIEKIVSPGESAKAARTSVPTVTVRKEDDSRSARATDPAPTAHDLLKLALQNPQPAANYLR